VGVGLHLASNVINALIIKGTPVFEGTSIKNLTFFWCTRPRISWFIVTLAPYQAAKSMYLFAIASVLFSEVILQLGVSERIGRLGEYWTETTRMANMKSDIASTQAGSLRTLKSKLSPVGQGLWKQQIDMLQNDLSTFIDRAVGEWDELKVHGTLEGAEQETSNQEISAADRRKT
jgi:hypothetical protein